jgi:putative DNA primase/helicase
MRTCHKDLEETDIGWMLQELTESILRHEMARAAFWYKKDKEGSQVAAIPPKYIIQDMLATPDVPLPNLTRVVEVPVFSKDGILIQKPGYHCSGIYFYSPRDLKIPEVPQNPDKEDVTLARQWIDELLWDFPFLDHKEKANAITVLIEPFARELIKGATPMRLIEAPEPGSGKSLLANLLIEPSCSRAGLISQCATDEEWNKSIIAQLMQNYAVILIDNVKIALDSGSLAAVLTSELYGGRLLGTNITRQWPNKALWLATGNNPTMTTEIARRTIRIRLNPKQEQPWQREGFRHNDIKAWALERRPVLIWAALTLIQNWIAKGKPAPANKPLGSFESWSRVMGGILAAADIDGFLENLDEFYEAADSEGSVLKHFVDLWFSKFGETKVSGAELFALTNEIEGFDFGRGGEALATSSLWEITFAPKRPGDQWF